MTAVMQPPKQSFYGVQQPSPTAEPYYTIAQLQHMLLDIQDQLYDYVAVINHADMSLYYEEVRVKNLSSMQQLAMLARRPNRAHEQFGLLSAARAAFTTEFMKDPKSCVELYGGGRVSIRMHHKIDVQ